jgi:hypothetical protein
VGLMAELVRAFLVDWLSELVRNAAGEFLHWRAPRGMAAIRRHVHDRCRRKLLRKISTSE